MATKPVNTDGAADALLTDAAAMLRNAYAADPVPPLRDMLPDATLDTAYAIQQINSRHWLEQGRVRVGAKIGLTARAVQKQLGVDQPDFGILFADMSLLDGATVPTGALLQPKVEAEIAFCLAREIDVTRLTIAELLDAVAYALPAIEIVDSRIADWNIGIVDTVADNASSGLFVLGNAQVPLGDIDLRLCGMVLEKNGEPVSFGAGAACLGNPLNALAWLATKMAALGDPLKRGDIILAGALGSMVAVEPGDHVEARIEGVGSVRVAFEGAAA